ncbi:MAG: right-handed parallel beta-helix repeat-containing protein [Ruminococcaceae bacterium]|nr:right-handed parallel beta-helix repeat-containing protein [Oscillospiraceae bacterium]
MVQFSRFNTTADTADNITRALRFCREQGEDTLVFEKGEYHLTAAMAAEALLCMSNHGDPGLKRIGFLLRDMQDFTLDGGGSTFIFEDVMQPVALLGCRNVTLKNFSVICRRTKNTRADIVRAGEDWMELAMAADEPWYVSEGELMIGERWCDPQRVFYFDEYDGETEQLAAGNAEYVCYSPAEGRIPHLTYSETAEGGVRVAGLRRPFKAGNRVVLGTESRCGAVMLAEDCVNTVFRDVTLYSGIGMGLIAQNCDGVELDRCATRVLPHRLFSLNSDATHFVHCKGNIHIHDCHFEGQHDDALNLHSVYLQVVAVREETVTVRFMHPETRGLTIFRAGDRAAVIDSRTLLSRGEVQVAAVRPLNVDTIELTLTPDSDRSFVRVGDCLHEPSYHATVLFERCTMVNNRARGVLLSGGADYTFRNNRFFTPGPAIRFACEAKYWYETGGNEAVLVENNEFRNCVYAGWGVYTIDSNRLPHDEGVYFRRSLVLRNNTFRDCEHPLADLYGFETVCFEGNVFEGGIAPTVRAENCGTVTLQKEIARV